MSREMSAYSGWTPEERISNSGDCMGTRGDEVLEQATNNEGGLTDSIMNFRAKLDNVSKKDSAVYFPYSESLMESMMCASKDRYGVVRHPLGRRVVKSGFTLELGPSKSPYARITTAPEVEYACPNGQTLRRNFMGDGVGL